MGTRYPAGRMEIIVVTDSGSTDATARIAESFSAKGVVHVVSPQRGKNACMDYVIGQSSADVIVFKDASGRFDSETVKRLVRRFRDPRIGCVGGVVKFRRTKEIGAVERSYWLVEEALRSGTESLGYMPSAPGGIHALRRSIYLPVGNGLTRDMVDPVQAIVQGYRAVREPSAICREIPWGGPTDVFRNRIRVTTRAWASIVYNARELWLAKRWMILFQLFSHKILRLSVWLPLGIVFVLNLAMAFYDETYRPIAIVQLAFYSACLCGCLCAWLGWLVPGLKIPTFLFLNAMAMAVGTCRYVVGANSVTWKELPHSRDSSDDVAERRHIGL